MPTLFLLHVPEFDPVIRACRSLGFGVEEKAGYALVTRAGEIVIERNASGLTEALWFGLLTGGYEGRVAEFSGTRLRLVD